MKRFAGFFAIYATLVFALTAQLGCKTLGFAKENSRAPFTLIALPDTQNYSQKYPDIFDTQTQWIRQEHDNLNIRFVVHEGDITNTNSPQEWKNADRAMSALDGVVPYVTVPGNHDMRSKSGEAKIRQTDRYNEHFGPKRFAGQAWYGGHFGEGNESSYAFFEGGGMKFLVIGLEFGPRDEVLRWADEIVSKHKNHRVIIVTHNYMYSDETRVGEGDKWNPHSYPWGGNDGEEMWTKFVSKHKNIALVLCGHILNDGLGRQTSVGEQGNRVHEILANYQMQKQGGEGWLRIMKFVPDEKKIYVQTYSPWLKKYATDAANQFELDLP